MLSENRLSALQERHELLKEELNAQRQRPGLDETVISRLKREKLWLKDQIWQLRNEERRKRAA